jgi:hypothetical protein
MSRKALVYLILTACLLGGFQNCSPLRSYNSAQDSQEQLLEIGKIHLVDAKTECEWLDSIRESMSIQPDGASFTGAVNMQSFATHISTIENAVGNVHLQGSSGTANVSEVKNFEGNLVLCDMSLGKVENFNGNIIVVSGNVVELNNVTGNVIVLGGIVGNVTGGNGLVTYVGSDEKVHVQTMGMAQAH